MMWVPFETKADAEAYELMMRASLPRKSGDVTAKWADLIQLQDGRWVVPAADGDGEPWGKAWVAKS